MVFDIPESRRASSSNVEYNDVQRFASFCVLQTCFRYFLCVGGVIKEHGVHFVFLKMFPETKFVDGSIYGNNVINFIKIMKEQGYTGITGVFGGVRADEFKKLFDKYEPETHVIKLERDEEKSISATKMRLAAFNNPGFFNEHASIGNMQATDIDELRNIVKSKLSFGGKLSFGKSKRSLKSVLLDIIYLKRN